MYPLNHYVNYDKFSVAHIKFLAFVSATSEPIQVVEAVSNPKWQSAMKHEIEALEQNGTWKMTLLPLGKGALEST